MVPNPLTLPLGSGRVSRLPGIQERAAGISRQARCRAGREESENLFEQVLEFLPLCDGETSKALIECAREQREAVRGGLTPCRGQQEAMAAQIGGGGLPAA